MLTDILVAILLVIVPAAVLLSDARDQQGERMWREVVRYRRDARK